MTSKTTTSKSKSGRAASAPKGAKKPARNKASAPAPAAASVGFDPRPLLALVAGGAMSFMIGAGMARIGDTGLGFFPEKDARAYAAALAAQDESYDVALAPVPGIAGRFLASHFAQSENDWKRANQFISLILEKEPANYDLIKRSMVLAMGDGDLDQAVTRARELLKNEPDNSLALLFLGVDAFVRNDPKAADGYVGKMAESDMSDFIKPLLGGWAQAGLGHLAPVPEASSGTIRSILLYHNALMALYLGDKEKAEGNARRILKLDGLAEMDVERVADIFAATGNREDALTIYEGLARQGLDIDRLPLKIAALKDGSPESRAKLAKLVAPLHIKTPAQGAALVMYDMGYILSFQNSDSSAKLFASMSLVLDPGLIEARLLLADMMSRSGRIDEAIAQLQSIPADDPSYLESQHHAAQLLADAGRTDESLALLNKLFLDHNDVDALIRTGDIYREKENYESALQAYNKAAKKIGGTIPEQYWYLLYGRGMAYEREGDWTRAQSDLKAALVYRPDHPYLLNYLAYGWADKGENLDESLALIKKAAALRPSDGYITDSLGWVEYMRGQYEAAIPNLERAVELLPYDDTINDHLGDAYWQVGRKAEARFQWQRAINNSKDKGFQDKVAQKLQDGLPAPAHPVRHASSDTKVE